MAIGDVLKKIVTGAGRKASSTTSLASEPAPEAASLRYNAVWLEHNLPESYPKNGRHQLYVRVRNVGPRSWLATAPDGCWVELVVYFGGTLHRTMRLPHDVPPGADVIVTLPLTFPDIAEDGLWAVTVSLFEQNVAWFHEHGMLPLAVTVRAEEPDRDALAESVAMVQRSTCGTWQPSDGVSRSRTGRRYPTVITDARGCCLRDSGGHEWIDYVMAGGAAVLGYAHPEVQAAVAKQLTSSAVITLPHVLEGRVSEMLCGLIPGAEMALFGKHGSDVCTTAVRTARLVTGRRKVLYSGYHGWHDWYVESVVQPHLRRPDAPDELFRFALNDIGGFETLAEAHRGEIAAVMLEPAAQAASLDDPPAAPDPTFLRRVAEVCRTQGAVLIFDEIVTGFRHPQGSVQQATGVTADLTCLGKALGGGMPLSALLGRRSILQTSAYAAYMPTFRGEVLSLAAAEAALKIYCRQNIPAQLQEIGTRLMSAINEVSHGLNVRGTMIGLPYRMIYRFDEPDEQRRVLMRTLLQQQLLQHGVLTYKGFMLPSLAHGEAEIVKTAGAFREALAHVQDTIRRNSFVTELEIPWF
jgi:glutamate-1-semialdehyde 2,1-aminomutase